MKKSGGIASLFVVAALIVILGFTTLVGFGSRNTGAMKNIKLGLDLAGGVSITYKVTDKNPTSEEMRDTVYKLQKRVDGYSTEATVYQEGDDRISIEIPGVNDANAILTELGKPGSLEFQTEDGETVLSGSDIKTAEAKTGQNQDTGAAEYMVELQLNEEGKEKFAKATEENIGKQIAIIYDGETISSPNVDEKIPDGMAYINGMSSFEEAEELASTIRIGGLKLELEELNSQVVGAQLGEEAISTSLKAGVIGLIIVFIFMCVVYLLPGLASSIALLIYTGIVLVLLNAFDITLTLPGIAGIILSIGMAVDANVIIFARVREEITDGKSVKSALRLGFQKALSAIVDGNVTTLIAAVVLWLKGTGSVKGFAQTLALGIVVSMFTALVITRMIINAFYAIGIRKEKFYAKVKPARKPINFLGKRKIFFAASIAVIAAGLIVMGVNGARGKGMLEYSLEFQGGTSTNVTFNQDYSLEEIDSKVVPVVEKATGDAEVQTQKVRDTNQVIIKTKALDLEKREALDQALVEEFQVDESKITYSNISSTISSEMRQDAIIAVAIAAVCMLLYIWFRFKDIRFATSSVAALVHDVLVVLVFYAVSRISVGNTFIACMLTIVGYSINATIVIFDRIREELKTRRRKEPLADIVNRSITMTLTRSIYTSLTTFIMIFVLFVMGVSSIKEFALPLMVGIVCGAYSSVCITGALWYVMRTKIGKNREKITA
ncbi:protein translocase subunit SecD [Sellimonas caecigallum]|uniref:Multifunctional fusion protein n=1 Tax=Sellimonas caecigallum TaxID=2592333 RepID=A0ABS7L4B2_9FIRM|nr:protein translocase subunit SecD [Sellimonas caecigallum]MBY0757788.1 protein translocase subunit SecD [Sellimonas caecigallum]